MRHGCKIAAAAILIVLLGLLMPVAFPLAESGCLFGVTPLPTPSARVQNVKMREHSWKSFARCISDMPVINDSFTEYDLKVIHNPSTGQIKHAQGTGMILWVAAALSAPYFYRAFFQKMRLLTSQVSLFSSVLLILQEKDGKK